MKDIIDVQPGVDLRIEESQVPKAANILQVQVGSLEYAPDLGVDLKFFLQEGVKFQDESFRAYLIQALAQRGINVSNLINVIDSHVHTYKFYLVPEENTTALIAR